jgi:putative hydrolase of the HAD superfamily
MKHISNIKRLIFDADDTLWENNIHYIKAAEDFADLMANLGYTKERVEQDFQTLEKKVVQDLGYGCENYIFVLRTLFNQYNSEDKNKNTVSAFEKICFNFESHLHHTPKIFPEVTSVLDHLNKKYPLYVLTKGNNEEQKRKLKNSDLLRYFQQAFVESEKDISTYQRILRENGWAASEMCMIGNSPKSDINPALRIGMCAVYIPYKYNWILEEEPLDSNQDRLKIVDSFADLPGLFIRDD